MKRVAQLLAMASILLALTGCEEEVIVMTNQRGVPPEGPGPAQNVGPAGGEGEGEVDAGVAAPDYRDEDFVEAETNRDPFHNYARLFVATGPDVSVDTRDVIMSDTGVEEMRVIAIITGMANPRAMIVDRFGVGHAVRRGDWLGRNEVVQAGGTEDLPVTLNWRVERIRPQQVVITREDPTAPNRPPLTRVLPLREEEQEERVRGEMQVLDNEGQAVARP